MAEGLATWSCPRCGEQMASDIPVCHRCGGPPGVFPVPAKRCPSCRAEVDEPAREGKIRCPKCGTEFGDYEEWVRSCRAAAFAAIRPVPPPPEEPPPRPPHLKAIGGSLLAMAGFTAAAGLIAGVAIPSLALALLQVVAGVSLLAERRHSDVLVRLAAGLSALLPFFVLPVFYFVSLFAFFSRPPVVKYFGGRVDPMPDRLRHPLIAWLLVVLVIVAGLFAGVVAGALDTAARWNDPLTPAMELGSRFCRFFAVHWWWAPAGVLGGLCVLALWGKVNRHGFLAVSLLALLGMISVAAPPVLEAWVYEDDARRASAYLEERNVQQLLWGVTVPDPKVRVASLRAMEASGARARVASPAIIQAFKDPDRRVRLAAACVMAQFDSSVEGVVPILIGVLEDDRSTDDEKRRAAIAFGFLGPRARPALSLLLDRLRSDDAATVALAELGPASIPGLTEALADSQVSVRGRAARALRLLGPAARSAVPVLLERIKDRDESVRAEAARALGEIHGEKAVPALRGLLTGDRAVAQAAAETLCALGEREGLSDFLDAGPILNLYRSPAICEHLNRTPVDKDLEGTAAEIFVTAGEQAAMCAEISAESAQLPAMNAFRRIHTASRKRSVLEVLRLFDIDYVLEPGIIRILTPEQSKAFWAQWRAEQKRK